MGSVMDERNKTATDNYRLLFFAVLKLCRSDPHVALAARLCGSVEELAYELHVPYLKTVAKWLNTPEPRGKLSTRVFKMVRWATHPLIGHKRIVYAPYYSKAQALKSLGEDACRRHKIADREHLNFGGKEGRCEDSALLVRDDLDRASDAEYAKSVIHPLMKRLPERERLALKLRYVDDMTLKECGVVLKVTMSRASQIIDRACRKLRDMSEGKPASNPLPDKKPRSEPPKPEPMSWIYRLPLPLKPEPKSEPRPEQSEDHRAIYALKRMVEAEGQQDRFDGLPVTANPYDKGTMEWRFWNNGWLPKW